MDVGSRMAEREEFKEAAVNATQQSLGKARR
jgi:hypothetical protein